MAQIIVRNLDDQVVRSLKTKAELHGKSLEQQLREILAEAARLTPAEKVALSRRARAMTPSGVAQSDSAELIRRDRDSR
jgi:plasmid stability protein